MKRKILKRRILWQNVLGRFWLWWHDTALPRRRHNYRNLTGTTWTCSCGSKYKLPPNHVKGY